MPFVLRLSESEVRLEAVPPVSTSSPSVFRLAELPPPTASRKRLYSPLSPCCTKSPAELAFSVVDVDIGGGAKSLKVVRASLRLAEVCIWSRADASCSLSIVELADMDAIDPRRFRKLIDAVRGPGVCGPGDSFGGPVAIVGGGLVAYSIMESRRGYVRVGVSLLLSPVDLRRDTSELQPWSVNRIAFAVLLRRAA